MGTKSEQSNREPELEDIKVSQERTGRKSTRLILKIATEDILAIACLLVTAIVGLCIAIGKVDIRVGLPLLVPFVGGAVIVQILKVRRGKRP